MTPTNPLESVIFINIPENFTLPQNAFPIDITIPLPVQTTSSVTGEFDIKNLSWEMILAGILAILAYDKENKNIQYYRSLLLSVRPEIRSELTEAAILKAKNEDYDIAEEVFAALRGLDPDDMVTVLNTALFFDERAESYRKSGLNEDADAYDESAHFYYKIALNADPAIPDAFFNAGFFYLKQRNFTRAKECFESFLALINGIDDKDMDENGKYKKERAAQIVQDISMRNLDDELFKSAYDFINMGQEEKGLEQIKQFIEKNPKIWNAWFMLGWALRRLQRWQDAKSAFLQSLDLGGENTDTYNELAICSMELNELSESKNFLIKALKLESTNTKVMSNLGFLALKEGDTEQAKKYFLTVLEFDPDDKIAKKALQDMKS